jgi:hypothetical protein
MRPSIQVVPSAGTERFRERARFGAIGHRGKVGPSNACGSAYPLFMLGRAFELAVRIKDVPSGCISSELTQGFDGDERAALKRDSLRGSAAEPPRSVLRVCEH